MPVSCISPQLALEAEIVSTFQLWYMTHSTHSVCLFSFGWGGAGNEQLCDGTAWGYGISYDYPRPFVGGLRWLALSPGLYHTCGIEAAGAIVCCGDNSWGQLGTGDRNAYHPLVNESLHKTWLAVSSADHHYTVAIDKAGPEKSTGHIYASGEEWYGR